MGQPIVLRPGQTTAVGSGLAVARVIWHEPPAAGGTATVRDAAGNVIAQLFYAGRGKGPEPQPVTFNPPVQVQGGAVHSFSSGGHLQVHLQGASGSGF
jgi:hypothetical protein